MINIKKIKWKPFRLRKHYFFQELVQRGIKINHFCFLVCFLPAESIKKAKKTNNCSFGISIPKNILKKAVERNKAKRQVKMMLITFLKTENFCQQKEKEQHYQILIIIKKNFLTQSFLNKKNFLKKLLSIVFKKN